MSIITSQTPGLIIAANVFATIFTGFGVNAMLRPRAALEFFPFKAPVSAAEQNVLDGMVIIYGARDIFMGVALYIAAYSGNRITLGWMLVAASSVAFVDGAVVKKKVGEGQWGHWGYAPVIMAIGCVLLGALDKV
ncbi:hypothetical protein C8J57DRAFT_1448579 [Mycena rebaudengoi]|nr:hypothetical protein C8J57DRAFT_1448579 [Mycena rebaudengoi]